MKLRDMAETRTGSDSWLEASALRRVEEKERLEVRTLHGAGCCPRALTHWVGFRWGWVKHWVSLGRIR